MHKKATAIVLLCIAGIPSLFSISFLVQRQVVRHLMKERLETQNLVTITLPKAGIKWHKANKEIVLNNTLFDVKTIIDTKDGYYIITGLYDYQEQQLHQTLEESISQNRPLQNTKKVVIACHNLLAILQSESRLGLVNYFQFSRLYNAYRLRYTWVVTPVVIPPPRLV